jgi:hypothetical protein
VPAGARPSPPSVAGWRHEPQTVLLDFHNALREDAEIEIMVDRRNTVGPLTMMLPTLRLADSTRAFDGWRPTKHGLLPEEFAEHASSFIQRLGEAVETLGEQIERAGRQISGDIYIRDEREVRLRMLEGIDRSVVYVADETALTPTISGIRLPATGRLTAVITVRAPDGAKPGDQFRFDVLQRRQGVVVGGSTYTLVVFERRQ